MAQDYVTRTFTYEMVTATVLEKGSREVKQIKFSIPECKNDAAREKKVRECCDSASLIFCLIDKVENISEKRRQPLEFFIANSEVFE